ncbi:hypothetical protein Afil01_00580 [Actinorhabdospora filicis]|uniref:Uncharacterized protein n=1 Tax=Actinorhabdospora filicis TaxID=1785913 RepID=A0A9W6SIG5_9ACTN|nr:hypothetical protein [Actinorhabdospora filicis]GLZ75251.1 hypothetical protein Afil01_00580 [Actinorhabdospora filicis]
MTLERGEDFADLATYVTGYRAGGYDVATVVAAVCGCGGRAFAIGVDDEAGAAERLCAACGEAAFIADSADYWEEAVPEQCACPCGGELFEVGVGFAGTGDGTGDVRWVSVGLRCLADGVLGVYTDWKIDYRPSAGLIGMV